MHSLFGGAKKFFIRRKNIYRYKQVSSQKGFNPHSRGKKFVKYKSNIQLSEKSLKFDPPMKGLTPWKKSWDDPWI